MSEALRWHRTDFVSVCDTEFTDLIVVQMACTESWQWTARGWRQPDDCDGATADGWVWAATRTQAEAAASRWWAESKEDET